MIRSPMMERISLILSGRVADRVEGESLLLRAWEQGQGYAWFLRMVEAQGGDPRGDGNGGPGYTIRCEVNHKPYGRGVVGMALSGKDTGGSQWFITHAPQPHLNGRYTIFARVVRGQDVVGRIVQGDRVLGVKILR
jgi:hypothetical protein